jgi:hypothetical protein
MAVVRSANALSGWPPLPKPDGTGSLTTSLSQKGPLHQTGGSSQTSRVTGNYSLRDVQDLAKKKFRTGMFSLSQAAAIAYQECFKSLPPIDLTIENITHLKPVDRPATAWPKKIGELAIQLYRNGNYSKQEAAAAAYSKHFPMKDPPKNLKFDGLYSSHCLD